MAQYINREKLLKRMEGYCKANCGCKPHEDALCPSCGLGDAIYMVEEQRIVNTRNMKRRKDATVALSKMEKTTQWIPVTERLPKEQETVLIWGEQGIILLNWLHDNKWCGCLGDVTHWMPLPKPPKEESNGV